MLISTAYAQTAGGGAGDLVTSLLPLVLIFGVFYLLLIRPQQKKQKEHKNKLSEIKRGDKIVTGGGIYGVVTKVVNENEVKVEIAEGVVIRASKPMVVDVLNKTDSSPKAGNKETPAKKGFFGRKSATKDKS